MASIIAESTTQTPRAPRPQRPNYAKLHAKPLPLETYPLPAFLPQNPLSILRIAYALISSYISNSSSHPAPHTHRAYYSAATRSVHVTDDISVRALWESGFFGKGSLSRSEPEWLEREKKRLGLVRDKAGETSAEITRKRREERREGKRERARLEREELEAQLRKEGKLTATESPLVTEQEHQIAASAGDAASDATFDGRSATIIDPLAAKEAEYAILQNQEHLQLIPYEAFFLSYALGILDVYDPASGQRLGSRDLLKLFRHTSVFPPLPANRAPPVDDPFILNYVVYHHFRSLGWVVRPGVKFSVDLLLYNRGPVFSHAEFAVLVVPDYSSGLWRSDERLQKIATTKKKEEWWWLHAANRVQGQVKKTLVLAYVEVPPPEEAHAASEDIGALLKRYRVKEVIIRRWTANRNR
ncbi:hypothetical protein FH972_024382 [Carpinus fangiana]|uniref:tRNA-splicing endonuclease subunit Sen2 n=1 Tax=Carpinus fangiana TaxID=176857 RepID=A0A5N6L0E2_9ROSI|nr:hypothetical protein FH972_024382 [Carpinus fangiana]